MSKPIEASIVVVDDEPSIRELLVASLHFAGFEVNTAASGSEAIEVIERLQPDLIVLDVMLPDIDGFNGDPTHQAGRHHHAGAVPDRSR